MPDREQLALPILLPDVPGPEDACVERLTSSLQEQAGIDRVHVARVSNDEPECLCVHYDPDAVSLSRIRQRAHGLGAEITDRYGHLVWTVEGVPHPRPGACRRRFRFGTEGSRPARLSSSPHASLKDR
jgi:Cd2+/Zn2+-exporting ATPase